MKVLNGGLMPAKGNEGENIKPPIKTNLQAIAYLCAKFPHIDSYFYYETKSLFCRMEGESAYEERYAK